MVKELGDSKFKYEAARNELERIFDRKWVMTLESALEEERATCSGCGQDDAESNMEGGLCYVCTRVRDYSDEARS